MPTPQNEQELLACLESAALHGLGVLELRPTPQDSPERVRFEAQMREIFDFSEADDHAST